MYFYFNLGEGICVCYLFRLSSPLCFISSEHSTGQGEYVLSTQSLYPSCPCLPGRTKHSYSHTQVTANHQCPLLTRTQEMHYHIRLCGRLPHAQLQTFCKLGAGCCHAQLPHQRDISIFSGLIFSSSLRSMHPTIFNMWPKPFAIIMFKRARCQIFIDNNPGFLPMCW